MFIDHHTLVTMRRRSHENVLSFGQQTTIDSLKDIAMFEQRLVRNHHHFIQIRQAILLRWKFMASLTAITWIFGRFHLLFSALFYLLLGVLIVLVGMTCKSGRLFTAEQYRQDVCTSLRPFNMTLSLTGELHFTDRVPISIENNYQKYRKRFLINSS